MRKFCLQSRKLILFSQSPTETFQGVEARVWFRARTRGSPSSRNPELNPGAYFDPGDMLDRCTPCRYGTPLPGNS